MAPEPSATVVVVCRDRWEPTLTTLETLLARTPPRHPIVVVDGNAPPHVAAVLDRASRSGRVRIVRRNRFLAGNEARNLGVETARTEWIAFVENDSVLSEGWIDELIAVAEEHQAASAYPAYLEPGRDGWLIHGLGADLELGETFIRERQWHIGRRWSELARELEPVARIQAEPHAMVIRTEMIERIGGLDEGLLSWFDHTDLALHHARLGESAWLVPSVVCTYRAPPPLSLRDLPTFLMRWSAEWYERSLARLCDQWSLDPHDHEWTHHEAYRRSVRRHALSRHPRIGVALDRTLRPAERRLVRRWDSTSPEGSSKSP